MYKRISRPYGSWVVVGNPKGYQYHIKSTPHRPILVKWHKYFGGLTDKEGETVTLRKLTELVDSPLNQKAIYKRLLSGNIRLSDPVRRGGVRRPRGDGFRTNRDIMRDLLTVFINKYLCAPSDKPWKREFPQGYRV